MTAQRARRFTTVALVMCGSIIPILTTGCHPAARTTGPVRAIWVTRYDYTTKDDVVRIMDNCRMAGFNTVLFQVRGNGTAFYKSSLEPWADELGGKYPGFDPLALACKEAHRRDMNIQAWVNVMPAWRGTKPPLDQDQLYHKRPRWFWYDQHGKRQGLSSFYVSLNPCLPEVRRYLVDVFREIVANYDVDGLHMDYIRFPNEPPATPKGSGIDYPRDKATLALFHEDTGLRPDADKQAWNQWRTDKVTQLVADIHKAVHEAKPDIVLSAAVGSVPKNGLSHFQDGRRWINDGIIDQVFLMNYTRNKPEVFAQRMNYWLPFKETTPIIPGLWINQRLPVDEGIIRARNEIAYATKTTHNFCLFAYSSIFDSQDDQLTKQKPKQRAKRQQRRRGLIPFLTSLAK